MAHSLSAFLAQNARKIANRQMVVSPRFTDEEGRPVAWEFTCLSAGDNQALRRDCIKQTALPGKRGQYTQDFDAATYQAKLAVRCTVYPDLHNAALQESYGVMGAEALIAAMLTPGEFDAYLLAITELNGFSAQGELVEEAKN